MIRTAERYGTSWASAADECPRLSFAAAGSALDPRPFGAKAERAKHKSLYETMKETQLASDDALAADRANAGDAELKAGEPYFRPVGVEHDVINDCTSEYAFIEVEMK